MNQYLTLRKAKVTKKHYENFPVATLLFPKAHRDARQFFIHLQEMQMTLQMKVI